MKGVISIQRLFLVSVVLVVLSAALACAQGFAHSQLKNPPMNPQFGKMWESIDPGEWVTLDIDDDRIAIIQFSFMTETELSSPGVMIYKLLTIPEEVPPPPGRAYQYYKIDYTNMVSWDISEARFLFKVDKAWLDEEQNSPTLISLFRLDKESWEEVPTRVEDLETNGDITYYAESEGARYYVVAVRGAPSNFEDFQTIDSSTLFLQQIGTDEIMVVKETEEGEEVEPLDVGEEEEMGTEEELNKTKTDYKESYFDKEAPEETEEVMVRKKTPYGWIIFILIILIIALLLYWLKTKPTIEKEILEKIKRHK